MMDAMSIAKIIAKAKRAGRDWIHEQLVSPAFSEHVFEQVHEAEKHPDTHWLVRTKKEALKAAANMLQDYRYELFRGLDLRDLVGIARDAKITVDVEEERDVARAVSEGIRDVLETENVKDWLADEILYRSREIAGLED
jgi:polyphosphate kinase